MLNGTETRELSPADFLPGCARQGAFTESHVRYVRPQPSIASRINSKYVRTRKGLKGYIKLDTSELAFFCRVIPLSLWVASLLAVARGGTLCQLGND